MERQAAHSTPIPLGQQLGLVLLYALGVGAALWQRGEPTLVLGVLLALWPLALLARLPRRWFPGWGRQILQVLVAGAGLAWWYLRLRGEALDVVLFEATAVLGAALAIGGVPKEYGMMVLLSMLMLGYGGLAPGRPAYLPLFAVYAALGILLMYQTRTLNLLGGGRQTPSGRPPAFVANWVYRFAHLTLAAALFVLLVTSFPMPQGRSAGVVPVGFRAAQEMQFPMLWRDWIRPTAVLLGRKSPDTRRAVDVKDPQTESPMESENATAVVPATEPKRTVSARDGGGGAGFGSDLAFRIHSPAKLYWLTQVFDVYDGSVWRASSMLRRGRSGLDAYGEHQEQRVRQVVSVEKAVTARLPGAYRATQHTALPSWQQAGGESEPIVIMHPDIGGVSIGGGFPFMPFRYECISFVPGIDAKAERSPWDGISRRGWNYRLLPEHLVSQRLRRLAAQVTADCDTPLQKATALQEFLRRNYTYTLESGPMPEDAEPVDYFLFESREGYCQHFAQALTVLARLVGLPARLAAGYSPGNYNLLGGYFDVYEYHAHAWTQIFIEPYGWLTFDGVAPGNLRLDMSPKFLGKLMDPFGEEWQARPPELSVRRGSKPPVPTPGSESGEADRTRRGLAKVMEDIYVRAAVDTGSTAPAADAMAKAAAALGWEWIRGHWERLTGAVSAWMRHVVMETRLLASRWWAWFRDLSAAAYAGMGSVWVALAVLWHRRRRAGLVLLAWWRRWCCWRGWRRLRRLRHGGAVPGEVVKASFKLLLRTLEMAHFHRPNGMDLLEYGRWLNGFAPEIGRSYAGVAEIVARQIYREDPPSERDADTAFTAVAAVRRAALSRLTLTGKRRVICRAQPDRASGGA